MAGRWPGSKLQVTTNIHFEKDYIPHTHRSEGNELICDISSVGHSKLSVR